VTAAALERLREVVGEVPDPEVPVLTIADLGILRDVAVDDDGAVVVTITPTYFGCPAMDMIRGEVLGRLREAGVEDARVRTVLAPAWTTDWMSEDGRRKLREYGIAPPARCAAAQPPGLTPLSVCCPACGSFDTRQVSRFGSTACKAHYVCNACHEPFDHFKTI
jgi:ring-1,2-phenylacetyl-CoA epoxidase subunit PaaD